MMSDVLFDDVAKLIQTLPEATDEQADNVYPKLGAIAPNSLVWIDGEINGNPKTANRLGMIIKDPKGKAVNLAILTTKPFLVNYKAKAGAGIFGDLGCDVAYVVDELLTALDLANELREHGSYCVLMAFDGIAKVAKAFCKSHRLIIPTYHHQKDELHAKIGNLPNVEIHACTDPILDTIERLNGNDSDTQVIKGLDYPYMGGFFVIKDDKLIYTKLNSDTDQIKPHYNKPTIHSAINGIIQNDVG